jgi:hypothetical protein
MVFVIFIKTLGRYKLFITYNVSYKIRSFFNPNMFQSSGGHSLVNMGGQIERNFFWKDKTKKINKI